MNIDKHNNEILMFIYDNMELLDWLADFEGDYYSLGNKAKGSADKFLDELGAKFNNRRSQNDK